MDIGLSAFNSSSSQVNDGIYDLGGGVFIDPTVAPQVSGGQGGSEAGGPVSAGSGGSKAPPASYPSLVPSSPGPYYPDMGTGPQVQGSPSMLGLSGQDLMIVAAVVVAIFILK